MKLGDQDKLRAKHKICCICVQELWQWNQRKKQSFLFGIPKISKELKNYSDDCYFCTYSVKGFNLRNKKNIFYPNISSTIRPVPHGPDILFFHLQILFKIFFNQILNLNLKLMRFTKYVTPLVISLNFSPRLS